MWYIRKVSVSGLLHRMLLTFSFPPHLPLTFLSPPFTNPPMPIHFSLMSCVSLPEGYPAPHFLYFLSPHHHDILPCNLWPIIHNISHHVPSCIICKCTLPHHHTCSLADNLCCHSRGCQNGNFTYTVVLFLRAIRGPSFLIWYNLSRVYPFSAYIHIIILLLINNIDIVTFGQSQTGSKMHFCTTTYNLYGDTATQVAQSGH
jgi:hypothetical protein